MINKILIILHVLYICEPLLKNNWMSGEMFQENDSDFKSRWYN